MQAAYKRVLELDPDHPEALAGLAAIQLSLSSTRVSMRKSMDLIFNAYNLDSTSAPVLNTLATAALLREDYNESKALAQRAVRQ